MYKWAHRAAWLVGVVMLFHMFYFWGGVALTPYVGESVMHQAPRSVDTFGVAFYAGTGKGMFGTFAPQAAQAYAQEQVGEVYASIDGNSKIGPETIRAAMPQAVALSHYGTPVAFVLALILYWLRPKTIKSLGR
jgi:hypothetical protein